MRAGPLITSSSLPLQLLARLIDRRTSVEKELGALGDQRKGGQDIFRHCRGFERAFQVMLNEANVAFKIRAVVEGTLPETLRRIPIEKRFNKNYTREVSACLALCLLLHPARPPSCPTLPLPSLHPTHSCADLSRG